MITTVTLTSSTTATRPPHTTSTVIMAFVSGSSGFVSTKKKKKHLTSSFPWCCNISSPTTNEWRFEWNYIIALPRKLNKQYWFSSRNFYQILITKVSTTDKKNYKCICFQIYIFSLEISYSSIRKSVSKRQFFVFPEVRLNFFSIGRSVNFGQNFNSQWKKKEFDNQSHDSLDLLLLDLFSIHNSFPRDFFDKTKKLIKQIHNL